MTNSRIYAEDAVQQTEPVTISTEVVLSDDKLSANILVNTAAEEGYEVTSIAVEGQEAVSADTASFTVDSNGTYSVLVSYQPKAEEEIPTEEIEEAKQEEEKAAGETEEGTVSETENKEEVPTEPEAPADTETGNTTDGTENTAEKEQTEESAAGNTEPAAETEQLPADTETDTAA